MEYVLVRRKHKINIVYRGLDFNVYINKSTCDCMHTYIYINYIYNHRMKTKMCHLVKCLKCKTAAKQLLQNAIKAILQFEKNITTIVYVLY